MRGCVELVIPHTDMEDRPESLFCKLPLKNAIKRNLQLGMPPSNVKHPLINDSQFLFKLVLLDVVRVSTCHRLLPITSPRLIKMIAATTRPTTISDTRATLAIICCPA